MVINPIVKDEGVSKDVFSSNLEHNVVHIAGEINDEMAVSVTAQLLNRMHEDATSCDIYINSPGGSVTAGLAIYDTMAFMKYKGIEIRTYCIGRAASMAAVLLSGGSVRYVLPHAEVMIHQPSGGMEGQSTDMLISAEHIRRTREVLNEILSRNTGKDMDTIRKDTERDFWMNADEALDYGIIDEILRFE